jgi:hypothetical protein
VVLLIVSLNRLDGDVVLNDANGSNVVASLYSGLEDVLVVDDDDSVIV